MKYRASNTAYPSSHLFTVNIVRITSKLPIPRVCINFTHKSTSNDRFFGETYYLMSGSRRRNIFYVSFCWRCLTRCLKRCLTCNTPAISRDLTVYPKGNTFLSYSISHRSPDLLTLFAKSHFLYIQCNGICKSLQFNLIFQYNTPSNPKIQSLLIQDLYEFCLFDSDLCYMMYYYLNFHAVYFMVSSFYPSFLLP